MILYILFMSLIFGGWFIHYLYIRKWTKKDWERMRLHIFNSPIGYYMMKPSKRLPPPFVDVDHSSSKTFGDGIRVITIPVRKDNYAYLVMDTQDNFYCAIDPSDPQRVLDIFEKEAPKGAKLRAVLVTHKHWDHTAGNAYMRKAVKGIMVWGPSEDCRNSFIGTDPWLQVNTRVDAGNEVTVGRLRFKAIAAPCHTRGSVMYYLDPTACPSRKQNLDDIKGESNPILFTGDTIFVGGCGKFLEGTPKDMHEIIYRTIATLPKNTYIYPGHEYSVSNLTFAKTLEPSNSFLEKQLLNAKDRKASRKANVPSLLEDEYRYNPFFRVKNLELRKNALSHASSHKWFGDCETVGQIGFPADEHDEMDADVVMLGIVRLMKDQFKLD